MFSPELSFGWSWVDPEADFSLSWGRNGYLCRIDSDDTRRSPYRVIVRAWYKRTRRYKFSSLESFRIMPVRMVEQC